MRYGCCGGQDILAEPARQRQSVGVVKQFLEQRRTQSLDHAPHDLTVDEQGIGDPATVMGDRVVEHTNDARGDIDRDHGGMASARIGYAGILEHGMRVESFRRINPGRQRQAAEGLESYRLIRPGPLDQKSILPDDVLFRDAAQFRQQRARLEHECGSGGAGGISAHRRAA